MSTNNRESTLVKVESPVRNTADSWVAVPDNELLADVDLPYGPEVPGAQSDGTIPRALFAGDLVITAAKFSETEPEDEIKLFVDGNQIGAPLLIVDQPDPVILLLPQADLNNLSEGTHEIHFSMGNEFGDPYVSQKKTIIIDKTAPGAGNLPQIRFKIEFEQNGVTSEQIAEDPATPGFLRGMVPAYFDQETGQIIRHFLQVLPAGPIVAGPFGPAPNPTDPTFVSWSLQALIDAEAAGDVEFWYTVEDRAGNIGIAPRAPLRMLVYDAPDQLIPPRIPLHADDSLINEGDARTPITVEIPQFGHPAIGDVIWLQFGNALPIAINPPLQSGDIPADPNNPDPNVTIRSVQIPYSLLWSMQPDNGSGGVNPVYSIEVSYEIRRGIFTLHSDPLTPVNVDLTIAGGPDPDPETPINENLRPPVLTHAGAGAVPNIIPVDFTSPVVATISNQTADTPPEEVFIAGDTVQLFRYDVDGTTEIAVGTAAAATPGTPLVITLADVDVIPGNWIFFYRVARTLVPGGQINEAMSPTQAVLVADADEQPGGADLLPNAVFRDSEPRSTNPTYPSLTYTRGRNGAIVRIYGYLNMKEDDEIVLTWQGNDRLRGNGNDIPATLLELRHTVVEQDLHEKDDRIPEDDPQLPDPVMRVFIDFDVPYSEIQKITPPPPTNTRAYGSAWVTYTVTAASGASNTSETDRTKFLPLVIDARAPSL